MSTPDAGVGSRRRILIALDTCHECRATLELAAALAAGGRAELVTLFIEDLDLVHAAAMPFVLEVDPVSGGVRPFGEEDLARRLRREVARVREELERISVETSVSYRMQVVRGRYMDAAVAAAELDVLFMGSPAGARRGREPRKQPPRGEVCILHDGSEAADRALALGRELASVQKLGLRVFGLAQAVDEALHQRIRESGTAQLIRVDTEAGLASVLAPDRCRVLLMPRSLASMPRTGAGRDWLRRLECPVVFVP